MPMRIQPPMFAVGKVDCFCACKRFPRCLLCLATILPPANPLEKAVSKFAKLSNDQVIRNPFDRFSTGSPRSCGSEFPLSRE